MYRKLPVHLHTVYNQRFKLNCMRGGKGTHGTVLTSAGKCRLLQKNSSSGRVLMRMDSLSLCSTRVKYILVQYELEM